MDSIKQIDSDTLYSNPDRKREIIEQLKEIHKFSLGASTSLDKKATDILGIGSAILGIVTAIHIELLSSDNVGLYLLGTIVVLYFYLRLVWNVLSAVAPKSWSFVPGIEDDKTNYDTLMTKYLVDGWEQFTDDEYLNILIGDYVGLIDNDDEKTFLPGAIQKIEALNQKKSEKIKMATIYLTTLIFVLITISFIALA